MGIVCLYARLSGRDVMSGDKRSPQCPSMRGFMSTALCIPNDRGLTSAHSDVLRHFSLKGRLDVTLWQQMSTELNQRRQVYRQSTSRDSINRSNLSILSL